MSAAIVMVVLMVLLWALTAVHRRRRTGGRQSRIRRPARRFVHRRERQVAALQARELVGAIIEHHPDPSAHLDVGVILQPGEEAWQRSRVRLAVCTTRPAWSYTRVSWLGRGTQNVTRESTMGQWQDHGEIDWLITSKRITGRFTGSGELLSVWWSGLAGVDIDLKGDRIVLNAVNGWTGMLNGPTLAPIAVAAVAMCHGLEAMLRHPALDMLRQQGTQQSDRDEGSGADGSGGRIVWLSTRRPTA